MMDKLSEYNEKRNFDKTNEPIGEGANAANVALDAVEKAVADESPELRFVIQHHLARRDHYDLRLEWNEVLLSWAVPKGPSFNPKDKRLAVEVEEHPFEYRNFEGTIPKGEYGGGVVMLWDEGYWEPLGNVEAGLRQGMLKFTLKGIRLKGQWALVRMQAKAGEKKNNWLLLKEKDAYTQTENGIDHFITSVRTGRTMAEIERGEQDKTIRNPFQTAVVQLAKLVNTVPEGEEWLYELKYDGYRIIAYVENNSVRLLTRNGNDYVHRFSDVATALVDWAGNRAMVLDGEMVVTDAAGKTDFQALQNYLKNPGNKNLVYIIFDILALDGEDLREKSLLERKEILSKLLAGAPSKLYYSRYVRGNGKESFAAACATDMEGIVGKKAESTYSGTRNGDWIKIKCDKRQEFVIGGYTLSDKKTSGISSLLLGYYEERSSHVHLSVGEGEDLVYAGRAGTGFGRAEVNQLEELFADKIRPESPFAEAPKTRANEQITWLEPVLVAEIKFAEWTKENQLRQASFKGIRTDKNPHEIRREIAEEKMAEPIEVKSTFTEKSIIIRGINITSPDKKMYDNPVITKAEVAQYYERVAERMLPYLGSRILSTVRCPKGIMNNSFYKKHPAADSESIRTILVAGAEDKESEEYFYIEDARGIISEVQMNTIEFHIWGSCVNELEHPDMMVFDLDPDEGMELSRIREGVRDLKSILTELSLNSYLKTSGGKGYHVVVPLRPTASWERFHDFARSVAEVMEQKWPDRYTSNIRKAKRQERIFIDWIRNGRGATSVAPYSLRAREGAAVSMPLAWSELDMVAPNGISISEALLRLERDDPWKDFFENDQMLK